MSISASGNPNFNLNQLLYLAQRSSKNCWIYARRAMGADRENLTE